ncbi:ral GTPase-activating protein subunit alpha-1-like [Panonychus citri]|uniref:ral GTPase-activating protein subunit alpha-1-like n=1 Tax=Panonychus citri TaxID=50023 RepID=UPI002307BF61|nr:ral GTPase-activating protein subunit alpha-1-like [Panonychus citri]
MGARKQEQTDLARCVVLNCLGIIVYQDLKNRNRNMSNILPEIVNIFIAETRFNNRYLSRVACDMLKLQTDHINFLAEAYPSIPKQIVEGLIFSITNHLTMVRESNSYKDYRNLLLSLLMCLGQWCLCLPRKILFSPIKSDQSPLTLFLIIQVLNHVISELNCDNSSTKTTINNPRRMESDNIGNSGLNAAGNGLDGDFGFHQPPSFRSNSVDPFSDKSKNDGLVIQLAAKMILGHILYFLDHFPLPTIGAPRLSSCINEADDNCFIPTKADQPDHEQQELTSDLFNAPNVLVCMVNNSSIVSFVDLSCGASNENALRNASANLIKNDPYIRIIVRDVIGKFTWDCCPILSCYRRNASSLDSYSLPTDDFSLKSRSLGDLEEKEEDDDDPCMRNDPLDLTLREIGKSIYTSKKYFSNTPVPALNDNLDQAIDEPSSFRQFINHLNRKKSIN